MIRLEIITHIPDDNRYKILTCWDNMLKHLTMESSSINVVQRVVDELSKYSAKISDGHIEFDDDALASMFILRWS
ncbi:MAG TPA: hypothetical protein DCE78_02300 [Bacteroidetes bacterium]|nr:hypothetical protein [Bacteroidota bacterium]